MNNTPKRLKVLLGCYACDPNFGSEPGTGWQFVKLIAKSHDVHVIVEKDEFEENLTRYSEQHPEEVKNITFHFIRRKHHNLLRKIWPPSYYWFYNKWQKAAYKYAVKLHEKEHFDLVHQITLVGFRAPGELWKLGIPYIWGPIGGLNHTAWSLLPKMGIYGAIFYTMRNLLNVFQKRWSKAARIVSQKAHTILVSDPAALADIKRLWKRNAIILREVGTSKTTDLDKIKSHSTNSALDICWAGVHEPRKGLNLLLEAIALCKQPVRAHILGEGPYTSRWKQLVKKRQIETKVTFYGKIPHDAVFNVMSQCHVFCITSISEGGTPNIVMEALQHNLPIVALNYCAYASVVNDTCGIKIDIHPCEDIPRKFAEALDKLAASEDLRTQLAKGARECGIANSWKSKLEVINRVYAQATHQ